MAAARRAVPGYAGVMLLLLAGCVAVPALSPPTRVSVLMGPGLPAEEQHAPAGPGPAAVVDVRAGVEPLGVVRDLSDRRFDLSAGAAFRLSQSRTARAGLFGEAAAIVWSEPLDAHTRARLRVYGGLDALAPAVRAPEWDPSVRVGVGLDLTGWADVRPAAAVSADGGWAGVVYGEWGLGVVAEGGWRSLPDGDEWRLSLGVEVQIPATLGVLFIPVPIR